MKLQRLIYKNCLELRGVDILQSDSNLDWELNEKSFSESGLMLSFSRYKLLIYGFFVMPTVLILSQISLGDPCIWCDKGQMNMGVLCWGNIILFLISLYRPLFAMGLLLGSMFSWYYFMENIWY